MKDSLYENITEPNETRTVVKFNLRRILCSIIVYLHSLDYYSYFSRALCLIIFNIFVAVWIFWLFIALNVMVNVPPRESTPSTQEIISNNPGLVIAVNSPNLAPYDCHDPKTFRNYVKNIDNLLRPYFSTTDIRCFGGGTNMGNCTYDPLLLAECSRSNYGFPSGVPCFYVKLTKIINYIPKHSHHNKDYIPLMCHYHGKNKNKKPISIKPSGILVDALPYTYARRNSYLSPLVAIRIPADKNVVVRCVLIADDIPTRGLFSPEYAVGKIEFNIQQMNNSYPCPVR